MSKSSRSAYTHIVVHPINEDNNHEVWASYSQTVPHLGTFDSDGLIGWIYPLVNGWVWVNEAGHPTKLFTSELVMVDWLKTLAPSMEWLKIEAPLSEGT